MKKLLLTGLAALTLGISGCSEKVPADNRLVYQNMNSVPKPYTTTIAGEKIELKSADSYYNFPTYLVQLNVIRKDGSEIAFNDWSKIDSETSFGDDSEFGSLDNVVITDKKGTTQVYRFSQRDPNLKSDKAYVNLSNQYFKYLDAIKADRERILQEQLKYAKE